MSTKVHESTNYDSFKTLDGNRHISNAHVKHLAESMRDRPESGPVRPILVNENMEIIDGQHRFEACKFLGLPIYYIKGDGLTLQDAQMLNATQRNWTPIDYAHSFAIAGDTNYQIYLDFKSEYKLPHNTTINYLTQSLSASSKAQPFREGLFKVKDLEKAHTLATRLIDLGEVTKDFRRRHFGTAFLLLSSNPKYRHQHFKDALAKYGSKYLARYEILSDYIRAFEAVYNYNVPIKNQIMINIDLTSL